MDAQEERIPAREDGGIRTIPNGDCGYAAEQERKTAESEDAHAGLH
jgi:hypothetical protein